MKRILPVFISLLSLSLSAQEASLSGEVTNEKNEAIPFATVQITNTSMATTTDADGQYLISGIDPGTYVVEYASLGHTTQSRSLTFEVKYFGIDPKTRKPKVSRKALLEKPEGYQARPPRDNNRDGGSRDNRGSKDNRGRDDRSRDNRDRNNRENRD